jgi:hypothetical protein
MNYTTPIFDAFDTVMPINSAKLPAIRVGGPDVSTTTPAADQACTELFGRREFDVFYHAFTQSFTTATARRRAGTDTVGRIFDVIAMEPDSAEGVERL